MLAPEADMDDVRRRALRCALHWWRSAVDPARVPLPQRARRRPGLTRADVAELAGLSLAWYTMVEVASPEHTCSPRTIDRIADALQLEPVDRAIFQTLASRETFRSLRVLFAKPGRHAA
jgi:Helix-turn-helix domain